MYLDQNVLGLQLSGELRLSKRNDMLWVYSNEHFAEIQRSASPEQYLSQLRRIDAKLLELELSDGRKILDTARVVETGDPEQHYLRYLEARADVPFDDTLFDAFQAWVNGGGDEGLFKAFPEKIAEQISRLIEDIPYSTLHEEAAALHGMSDVIGQMVGWGNNIQKTRKALGVGKGVAGAISGDNALREIWNIIGAACNGITCDQFFGFDPPDKQGYETWPQFLGIVGCCAVLDIVGFQAEKKCRKIEKIPNVRSDSAHIAMGAFCSALLSEDKRLARRANAIYRYRGIGTAVLLLQ